ncbi:hypothetical protein UA08_08154 [Talaromyces atroroseus]|uniref:Uncharacterized protein n=1 Tax=Talaromyces atroroseus TaxID=1441469 RepID=A0A225AQA1_TALAT|nr:hypothetical protein UA08_08154 [Talaromyces atroroseus]OKL56605.1 hypothetical protein UA08_08154 [Talaromyces atroroseus]
MLGTNVKSVARFTSARTLLHATDGNGYGSKTSQDDVDTQQPQATQLSPRPPSLASPSSRDSTQSQRTNTEGKAAPVLESQEVLASQLYPVNPRRVISVSAIPEPPATNRSSLLQLLKIRRPQIVSPKDQPQQVTLHSSDGDANGSSVPDMSTSRGNTDGQSQAIVRPGESEDVELSSRGQAPTATSPRLLIDAVENPNTLLSQQPDQLNSPSQGEVTSFQKARTSPRLSTSPIVETTASSTDNARTDVNVENSRSAEITETKTNSDRNIWNNIAKLGRRDVAIPKDQEELLDRHDCWIPADVGEPTPQGHVPTTLLQEWNAKMIRLFREKRKNMSSKKVDSSPEKEGEEEGVPSSSGIGHLSENDSDSGSETSDWSISPTRHIQRPRAPSDSPIRQQSIPKPAQSPKQTANKTTDAVDGIAKQEKSHISLPTSPPSPTIHPSDPMQETNEPKGDQGQASTLSSASDSIADPPSNDARPESEAAESSDESDMETSIPQALLTSSQSIANQVRSSESVAPVSSNTSSAPLDRVQILDTLPAVLKRTTSENAAKVCNLPPTFIAQRSSPGGDKSSSQVIANSVNSTGNTSAQEHGMDYNQKSLVADSQRTNSDLHDCSLPSHQDSQRLLEFVPESSLISTDLHTQVYIRDDQPVRERTGSSSKTPMTADVGGKLKRKAEDVQSIDTSPSKRPRNVANANINTSSIQLTIYPEPENVHEDRHKHIFSLTPDGPLKIFEMFKKSYAKYAGDFDHFVNMCRRLQSLRSRGILRRCFLWDEFVMRHLLDYRNYVQARIYAKKHWDNYEEYFCNTFTQPSFKQRSLTPRTLDIVASKRDDSVPADWGTQTIIDNLMDSSVTHQSPSFAVDLGNKATLGTQIPHSSTFDVIPIADKSTQADLGFSLNTPAVPTTNRPCMIDSGTQIIEESQATTVDDDDMSESEIDEDSADSEHHETASIELGIGSPEEEEDDDDYDYDYDDDLRANLISRIRRENQQSVQAIFNTAIPGPAENSNYLDDSTPFMKWVENNENFSLKQRGGALRRVSSDRDGDILTKECTRTKSNQKEKEKEERAPNNKHIFNAFRKSSSRE